METIDLTSSGPTITNYLYKLITEPTKYEFLIISYNSQPDHNYYIQFLPPIDDLLYAEAVSNAFIPTGFAINENLFFNLGWNGPDKEHENFWREWAELNEAAIPGVTKDVISILTEVYQVAPSGSLRIELS